MSLSYAAPIAIIVACGVVYHISAKYTPAGLDPLASLTVTYAVGTAVSAVLYYVFNRNGNLIRECASVNWVLRSRPGGGKHPDVSGRVERQYRLCGAFGNSGDPAFVPGLLSVWRGDYVQKGSRDCALRGGSAPAYGLMERMNGKMKIRIKKLKENAVIPTRGSSSAAGYDLYACLEKPVFSANCVGVVDSDYRGEYIVALHNDSETMRTVVSGERIAQLVILPYLTVEFVESDTLSGTERGAGGFGSTGK